MRAEGVLKRDCLGATGVKSVKNVLLSWSRPPLAGEIYAPILSIIGIRDALWPAARATERVRETKGSSFLRAVMDTTSREELVGLGLLGDCLPPLVTICGGKCGTPPYNLSCLTSVMIPVRSSRLFRRFLAKLSI